MSCWLAAGLNWWLTRKQENEHLQTRCVIRNGETLTCKIRNINKPLPYLSNKHYVNALSGANESYVDDVYFSSFGHSISMWDKNKTYSIFLDGKQKDLKIVLNSQIPRWVNGKNNNLNLIVLKRSVWNQWTERNCSKRTVLEQFSLVKRLALLNS